MLSDQEWYERIVRSINDDSLGLPGFPSSYLQEVFVGHSNEKAIKEAYDFYRTIKAASYPLDARSRILDFGVGWGRILRFFSKDIPAEGLHGVDVDNDILDEARRTGVKGVLSHIDPLARLDYPDAHFDVVYAFSVFSHLSESSARFWLPELMRVLKPGGTLVVTSTTQRFLNLCKACMWKSSGRNQYEEDYARMFADPDDAMRRYNAGEYVYAPVSGNAAVLTSENYGWASMPLGFVKRIVGSMARSVRFFDDPSLFEQGYFIVRRSQPIGDRIVKYLRHAKQRGG